MLFLAPLLVGRRGGVFSRLSPALTHVYAAAGFALGVNVLLGGDGVSPREIEASRPRACGGGDDSPSDREGLRLWGGEDSETEG